MKIYKIKVNGKSYRVELESVEEVKENKVETKPQEIKKETKEATSGGNIVYSPIQGVINDIKVKVGDKVKIGDVILVVEAMKLENDVVSTFEGEISEIFVNKGQNVASKEKLVSVK